MLSQRVLDARIKAAVAKKELEALLEYDELEKEVQEKQSQLRHQQLRRKVELEELETREFEEMLLDNKECSDLFLSGQSRKLSGSMSRALSNAENDKHPYLYVKPVVPVSINHHCFSMIRTNSNSDQIRCMET